uniref:Uncharacterized protein n=1 Tax=Spongospora subterranea TaxID=70186 RepID=A0A0H5QXV1_9EUKA|eukprot:CRZ06577.1 hypothetical protein [Spongospora subterranea]
MVFVMISIFCIASVVSAGPLRHRPIREKISPFGEKGVASPSFIEQGLLNRRLSICSASIDLPPGSSSAVPEFAYCASSSSNPPSSYASLSVSDPPYSSDCSVLKLSLNSQPISHVDSAVVEPGTSIYFPLSPEGVNNGQNSNTISPPSVPDNSAHPLSLELSLNSQWSRDPERAGMDSFEVFVPFFIAKLASVLNGLYPLLLKNTILSHHAREVIQFEIIKVSSSIHLPLILFVRMSPPEAVHWLRNLIRGDLHGSQFHQYNPDLQTIIKAAAPGFPLIAGSLFYCKLYAKVVQAFQDHLDNTPTNTEWETLIEFNTVLKRNRAQIVQKLSDDPNSTSRKEILLNGLIEPTLYIVKALRLNRDHCQYVLEKVLLEIADSCVHKMNDSLIVELKSHVAEALSGQNDSPSTIKSSLLTQFLWDIYKERLESYVGTCHEILAWIYINEQIAIERTACSSSSDWNHVLSVRHLINLINTLKRKGERVMIYRNRFLAPETEQGDLYFVKVSERFATMFKNSRFVLEKAKKSFIAYLSKI